MEDVGAMIETWKKEWEKDDTEYKVNSGCIVKMNDNQGTYLVTDLILDDTMRKTLDMKIWGFFAMIDLGCGINWADPVPRMTEGSVDIRKIMGVGGDRIVDVVFNSMTKTADGKITRTYDVHDSRNEITQITVESR